LLVDDDVAIAGDGVFCFLLLLLLQVDGDGDADDDRDFDCDDLKSDNILAIDGGMDGGDDVRGCCGDIVVVGSNMSSLNDCTTSASRNRSDSVGNDAVNDSDEWIVSGIPVIVIVLSSHNEIGADADADADGIDSDE